MPAKRLPSPLAQSYDAKTRVPEARAELHVLCKLMLCTPTRFVPEPTRHAVIVRSNRWHIWCFAARTMKTSYLFGLLFTTLLGACGAGSDPGETGDAGGGSGGTSASNGGSTGSFENPDGVGGATPEGCQAVDVLFVIDNSGSMADQQASLVASFPGFVAGIKQQLEHAPSYHVGVVTSDDYWGNEQNCRNIGDLVTQTSGHASSNQVCGPFAGGGRFMSDAEPNLSEKFSCAARVGDTGADDERMMRALLNAVEPGRNAAGGCNEGFSRTDALLVIVIITDEDDVKDGCIEENECESYGSGGDPDAWVEELVSYRGGIKENIVVLSLLGKQLDNDCGALVSSKILGFTNRFDENGYTGDVCSGSYDSFFTQVLPVIDEACQQFEPPQ